MKFRVKYFQICVKEALIPLKQDFHPLTVKIKQRGEIIPYQGLKL